MICGVHAVYEVLSAGSLPVERIHILRDARLPRLKQILDLARERGVPVRKEERAVLDKIAGGVVHQGIVAIAGEVHDPRVIGDDRFGPGPDDGHARGCWPRRRRYRFRCFNSEWHSTSQGSVQDHRNGEAPQGDARQERPVGQEQ